MTRYWKFGTYKGCVSNAYPNAAPRSEELVKALGESYRYHDTLYLYEDEKLISVLNITEPFTEFIGKDDDQHWEIYEVVFKDKLRAQQFKEFILDKMGLKTKLRKRTND